MTLNARKANVLTNNDIFVRCMGVLDPPPGASGWVGGGVGAVQTPETPLDPLQWLRCLLYHHLDFIFGPYFSII